jgi:hypothetical protein
VQVAVAKGITYPRAMPRDQHDDDAVDVLPVELDAPTRARFASYCRAIGRGDEIARCASEIFRDLIWDAEFAALNAEPKRSGLHS